MSSFGYDRDPTTPPPSFGSISSSGPSGSPSCWGRRLVSPEVPRRRPPFLPPFLYESETKRKTVTEGHRPRLTFGRPCPRTSNHHRETTAEGTESRLGVWSPVRPSLNRVNVTPGITYLLWMKVVILVSDASTVSCSL